MGACEPLSDCSCTVCKSECGICQDCVGRVSVFTDGINADKPTSFITKERWLEFCREATSLSRRECLSLGKTLQAAPELAQRPAALCGMLGECKNDLDCPAILGN